MADFSNKKKVFKEKILYYNYHAIIKKKLLNGELLEAKVVKEYNKISPCLILIFPDKTYPIREHKFEEYFKLLEEIGNDTVQWNINI